MILKPEKDDHPKTAESVAPLAKRLLFTPEVPGSNPIVDRHLLELRIV